jgi:hypothetical protein
MAAPTSPDAWMETCLIAISSRGGSDQQFAALTENVRVSVGRKPYEGIALVNGGRIGNERPQEDTTVTMECYFVDIGVTSTNHSALQIFATGGGATDTPSWDDSDPKEATISRNRRKVRVALLWTDGSETTANGAVGADTNARRLTLADGEITNWEEDFTGGILKVTCEIIFPPFDKDGTGCLKWEHTNAAGFSALSSYTTSNKF